MNQNNQNDLMDITSAKVYFYIVRKAFHVSCVCMFFTVVFGIMDKFLGVDFHRENPFLMVTIISVIGGFVLLFFLHTEILLYRIKKGYFGNNRFEAKMMLKILSKK